MLRTPQPQVILAASTALAASFTIMGVAARIMGYGDVCAAFIGGSGTTGNPVVEFWVEDDITVTTAPTVVTLMHLVKAIQVTGGASIDNYTLVKNTKELVRLAGVAGNWLIVRAKYDATDGNLNSIVATGNISST